MKPSSPLVATSLAHAGLLAAMHRICFKEFWDEAAMASLLTGPGVFGLLAGEPRPEGFILCRVAADEAEVLTLMVLPLSRRRGLARTLLAAAMERARAMGAETLFLEVAASNQAARTLYAGLGFEEKGKRAGYYGPGSDALLLGRPLALKTF